jgi:hypothetical protein
MELDIKYNSYEVGKNFIQYFYNSWLNNPQDLLHTVIGEKSKIKYNELIYEYTDFVFLLNQLKTNGLDISVSKYEILDSRSRQIYILTKGIIKNAQSNNNFSQTFILMHNSKGDNEWILINSILIIE